VIELSAGEPDFGTPEPISAGPAPARSRRGSRRYTANPGMPELREAIASHLREAYGLDYAPGQVLCSNGAKQSVAQALLVAVRPGDEVVIPAPTG
jgi:aspartate aminotransferase